MIDPAIRRDLHAPVHRFGYNPSAWSQRVPVCILAGVAFVVAAYMALYQWRLVSGVWDPMFGSQTEKVLDSETAGKMHRFFRAPDAAIGALAYLGDVIFGLAGSTRRWQYRPWMVILFGIDVIPLGIVSAVLVFMQGFVVGFWCFPCLVTAVISMTLVYFAYDEVWSSLLFLREHWRRTQSLAAVWTAFWGGASEAAEESAQAIITGSRAGHANAPLTATAS